MCSSHAGARALPPNAGLENNGDLYRYEGLKGTDTTAGTSVIPLGRGGALPCIKTMASADCDALALNLIHLQQNQWCYQIPLPVRNSV